MESEIVEFLFDSQVTTVVLYGLVTALATGLGVLPFLFVDAVSPRLAAWSNAVAAGLMSGACFGLVAEGTRYGSLQTIAGATLGVLFILVTQRLLDRYPLDLGGVSAGDARRMVLMIVVMTVHSFAEGVAVGASFGGGMRLATVITAAIAVHNIPEGLAIAAVLRPRGVGLLACAGWSVFSSLPQPLMAAPTFLFVELFQPALPYGVGFAAGAMVFMVIVELLPEAYEQAPRREVALLASLALLAMLIFQRLL